MKKQLETGQKKPKKCLFCGGNKIHKHGLVNNKIRWKCVSCNKTFTRKRPDVKQKRLLVWFEYYLQGLTLKQLSELSGYSTSFLWKYINDQLNKPVSNNINLSKYQYLIFDGKYLFGRKYCLIVLMDALTNIPIASKIVKSETRKYIEPWLKQLKEKG